MCMPIVWMVAADLAYNFLAAAGIAIKYFFIDKLLK
jgi:hypothetical protein